MAHSTLTVSDFQFLQAFRSLLPLRLLRQAVAATLAHTRQRLLPAFLLLGALVAWFFYAQAKLPFLVGWLCRRPQRLPSDSALYQARARLGWAPLRWLCRRVLRPLADPRLDPSAFYHGRRLLALDGTTLTVADTPANDRSFGRAGNQHGQSGYPLLRLAALCEVGTHALLGWIARAFRVGEQALAARLWPAVPAGALLLADRNFHAFELWQAAAAGGWDLLLRLQAGPKFAVEQVLPDGSYLSQVYPRRGRGKKARALRVRVLTYAYTDEQGRRHTSRLLTGLLDAASHPARVLVELYHRRWEQEGVFREVKAALAGRATQLRAHEPRRALQELDGLLLGHFVLRWALLQAARRQGVAAVALSFVGALRLVQTRLAALPSAAAGRGRWWQELLGALGREGLPQRRRRSCPRKKKVTRAAWPVKREGDKEHLTPSLEVVPQAAP
jgi:hypothetical protein